MSVLNDVLVCYRRENVPSFIPEALRRVGIEADYDFPSTVEEWINILDTHRVALLGEGGISGEMLKPLSELKMIQRWGIGYDTVDVETATEKGIIVCNIPEIAAETVAQHAWGLILSLSKWIAFAHKTIQAGGWEGRLGTELWGKTLGIIGLGAIGKRIARIARAFHMKILVFDPYVSKATVQLFGGKLVDLKTVLRESDVVSISTLLTEETVGMIGREELALMKKSAFLVNTSRGRVVQEEALIYALKNGLISGVGLDVFEEEPLPISSPLRSLDNVVLTPHIAADSIEALSKMTEEAAVNISMFLKGQRPRWIVNAESLREKGFLK